MPELESFVSGVFLGYLVCARGPQTPCSLPLNESPASEFVMKVFGTVAALLFLFLLSPPPASSQTSLGFQAGLSMGTLAGKDKGGDFDYRMAFGGGAFLNFSLSEILSVQPELSYMSRGAKESYDGYDIKLKLNYIEIPVLLKFDVPMEADVSPYFMLGPSFGFKVGCTVNGDQGGTDVDVDCDESGVESSGFDFGGVVAAGIGFPTGPGQTTLGARYYAGFTSIDGSEEETDVKNRGFFFSVGYSFPIGG